MDTPIVASAAVWLVALAAEHAFRNALQPGTQSLIREGAKGSRQKLAAAERNMKSAEATASAAGLVRAVACLVLGALTGVKVYAYHAAGSGTEALIAAIAVLVFLIVGELIVRGLASGLAPTCVLHVGTAVRFLFIPFLPAGKLYEKISGWSRSLLRSNGDDEPTDAEREIQAIVDDEDAKIELQEDQREFIESVIGLRGADVAQIMTPRTDMVSVEADKAVDEAAGVIRRAGFSRIPVFDGTRDNIVGVLYAKDLLEYWHRSDRPELKVRDLMRKPVFIPETRPVLGLLQELARNRTHLVIVLDEYGGTAGLLTLEDIVEEIVGEIADEYDAELKPQVVRTDENTVVADARTRVDELEEEHGIELPQDAEYDTVGGFVVARLGRIPRKGDVVVNNGWKVEVLAADARKVIRVRIVKVPGDE